MSSNNLNQSQELKNTSYELFMLLLSVLSIFNLLVFVIPRIDPVVVGVVAVVDGLADDIFARHSGYSVHRVGPLRKGPTLCTL